MPTAFPFRRNLADLRDRRFDVLVVGGGIYGAWTAYDAAQRGLAVALIEQDDWAAGTSSASSKLIHGGLRYLEHYEFGLVRHALQERRRLFRIAPHLVRPLDFMLPMWEGPRASPFMISAGLVLYDMLALGSEPVQRHRFFRAGRLRALHPYVDPQRLIGGFRYGDCQEDDARMTLLVAATAQAHGAACANHLRATGLLERDGRVAGARVEDRDGGAGFDIEAQVVVNASGPWVRQLLGARAPRVKLVKGTHFILPAIAGCSDAFLLTARDGRVFFVIPWYGRSLVGTTESEVADPQAAQPTEEEAEYLLDGVRRNLPGLGWTRSDVIAGFSGVRMLQAEDEASLSAVTREFEVVAPQPGLVGYLGGKFTTARADASEIVDAVFKALGRKAPACRTGDVPLPGAPPLRIPFAQWRFARQAELAAAGVDAEAAAWAAQRHGQAVGELLELVRSRPELGERIHPDAPFLKAEVVRAVQAEMARSVDDIGRRRLPLSLLVRGDEWRPLVQALADTA